MDFPVKVFTIKGNLVFMNNLYHKVAVASVGIALGFALGANKEARAATFTFTSTSSNWLIDYNQDGVGDYGSACSECYTGVQLSEDGTVEYGEYKSIYGFDITDLSLDSTTRIKSAIFHTSVDDIQYSTYNASWGAYGYTEYSQLLYQGEPLAGASVKYSWEDGFANFNVLQFIVDQKSENNNYFWLGLHAGRESFLTIGKTSLIITTEPVTTEPVPEPTTIFGSAIGLCLGGWLKRKNSSQQNKTKSSL
jgi:hypothetical protein